MEIIKLVWPLLFYQSACVHGRYLVWTNYYFMRMKKENSNMISIYYQVWINFSEKIFARRKFKGFSQFFKNNELSFGSNQNTKNTREQHNNIKKFAKYSRKNIFCHPWNLKHRKNSFAFIMHFWKLMFFQIYLY